MWHGHFRAGLKVEPVVTLLCLLGLRALGCISQMEVKLSYLWGEAGTGQVGFGSLLFHILLEQFQASHFLCGSQGAVTEEGCYLLFSKSFPEYTYLTQLCYMEYIPIFVSWLQPLTLK